MSSPDRRDTALPLELCGLSLRNPILPAAGPNVRSTALLSAAATAGAGGLVAKTVSVRAASDPRPTMHRIGTDNLLNCETWLEEDPEAFSAELAGLDRTIPLIISIGYKPEEVAGLARLFDTRMAPDAYEFSTHYTGSEREPLIAVARRLRESTDKPIIMKLSPGFPDLMGLAAAAEPYVDGFAAVNSLGPCLDFDAEKNKPYLGSAYGQGWLSGPAIKPLALDIVYRLTRIVHKPVIGVGGISTGRDAAQFLMAGAAAVQVCTAALKGGPGTYGRIAAELKEWMRENRYASLQDLRGRYHQKES